MPSRVELARNNIRAGVFVTVALLLMIITIIVLTDVMETVTRSRRQYFVTFPVAQGVSYLGKGSGVRLGGMQLGRVLGVVLEEDDPARTIRVQFEIDSNVALYENAQILVKSQLIGADSWLEIPFVGDGAAVDEGGTILGTTTPGLLSSLLGAEGASQAESIVENADVTLRNTAQFSEFLSGIPGDYEQQVRPTLENTRLASEDVRALTGEIRNDRWPAWAAKVDEVMTWAGSATTRIDEAVEEGRGMLVSTRSMVEDNRPQVDTIVDNVEVASADVAAVARRGREETVDKVHAVLDRGRQALDDATEAISTFRRDYDGWATRLDVLLANATLASQELKFATIEVRRSPWKILYRPTAKELENELLYEAARSFAVAASDLRSTSDSVERILQNHGDRLGESEEALEQIRRDLQRSLDNYTRAQQDLLDVLVK